MLWFRPTRREAELDHLYFAYGSNLVATEILRDVPNAEDAGMAILHGYRFEYSKHSKTRGRDAATIHPAPDSVVWGFLYRVDLDGKKSLKKREGGYEEIAVKVFTDENRTESIEAFTFEAREICEAKCGPSPEYQQLVARGARLRGIPESYIRLFIEGFRQPD